MVRFPKVGYSYFIISNGLKLTVKVKRVHNPIVTVRTALGRTLVMHKKGLFFKQRSTVNRNSPFFRHMRRRQRAY